MKSLPDRAMGAASRCCPDQLSKAIKAYHE